MRTATGLPPGYPGSPSRIPGPAYTCPARYGHSEIPGHYPATMADPCQILLVEDDDGDALLVEEVLSEAGMSASLRRASSLAEARRMIDEMVPDVVLLDLNLPDEVGVPVVHQVVAASPGSAVLVLTGLDAEERGVAAVAAGAEDYLVKGQVDGALLERSIRYALGRKQYDESVLRLVESELRAEENTRLERGLLPQPYTTDKALHVITHYRPGRHQSLLGGDFYDVVEGPDGSLHAVIGDVSGHGPDEAALGVLLRVAWRTLVLAGADDERILPLLGEVLAAERQHDETFATVAHLVVAADLRSGRLWLAGHPAPLVLVDQVASLSGSEPGPPIGLGFGAWKGVELDLWGSWPILLHTDGLIDAHDGAERLGEQGLVALISQELAADPNLRTLLSRVLDSAELRNEGPLADDVALVILDHPKGHR
jgi:serine phosphatase RsbU (regulator of sigma subunit)